MTSTPRWRKSTHSTNQETCVEVAGSLDALRDGKNPNGPQLRFAAGMAPFLAATKVGRFNRS